MPIHLLAILTPKPEKLARVEEIAQDITNYVTENEPGTLKYQWFKAGTPEQPKVVVWEIYADEAAVEAHKANPKFAKLVEIEEKEKILAAPLEVLPLEQFAGFASRDAKI